MLSPILLCIDDRPQLLELRKAGLKSLGFSVEIATNGISAIHTLEIMPVAAVLIEYKSEGLDAEAVAFQIKQRFPAQPIILLSAYSDMPERVLWLVDECVMRSEPLEGMVQTIERVTRGITTGEARKHPVRLKRKADVA